MGFTKIVHAGIGTVTNISAIGEVGFSTTTSLQIPKGTTGARPGIVTSGLIRYNTTTKEFEGYGDSSWGNLGGGGGATGGGTGPLQDDVFYENSTNVTQNYSITSGKNAMSAGPITLDANVVVTIPAGSVWTVV